MRPEYERKNNVLVVTTGKQYTYYPTRFHKHVEIVFVREGTMDVVVDSKTFSLKEGDLYIVFPNLLHSIPRATAPKYLIMADPELFPDFCSTLTACKPVRPVLLKEEQPLIVAQLCHRMLELAAEPHQNHQLLVLHSNCLLAELLRIMALEERSEDSTLLHRLVVHLLEHYTEDVTLESVSEALGYSKYHISHAIAHTFRCNFRTLLNAYRITTAQNQLLSTEKTVSQIAAACGFQNQSSFNRIFLKHCGITPSSFLCRRATTPNTPAE